MSFFKSDYHHVEFCFSLSFSCSLSLSLTPHYGCKTNTQRSPMIHCSETPISLKRDKWRGKGEKGNRGTDPGSTVTMCRTWVITSPFYPCFLFAFSFLRAKLHCETWGTLQFSFRGPRYYHTGSVNVCNPAFCCNSADMWGWRIQLSTPLINLLHCRWVTDL